MGLLAGLKLVFGGFIENVLGRWQVLLIIVVVGISLMVFFNIRQLEKKLEQSQQTLKIEQENNKVLRENLTQLQLINTENQAVIGQVTADKNTAIESVTSLSAELTKTNKSLTELKTRINAITTPPTKLSPYIAEAISGIQTQRGHDK